jgi:hypothetical protein
MGVDAKAGNQCLNSPLAIGFPPEGADNAQNDINQIYYVRGLGMANSVGAVVGWIYQTNAGGTTWWFQPNISIQGSVSVVGATPGTPYFKVGGIGPQELTAAMNKALGLMALTPATAPLQIAKLLNAGLLFTAAPCYEHNWNGTYT